METVEMDLLQAQIAELTTEVARLQMSERKEIRYSDSNHELDNFRNYDFDTVAENLYNYNFIYYNTGAMGGAEFAEISTLNMTVITAAALIAIAASAGITITIERQDASVYTGTLIAPFAITNSYELQELTTSNILTPVYGKHSVTGRLDNLVVEMTS